MQVQLETVSRNRKIVKIRIPLGGCDAMVLIAKSSYCTTSFPDDNIGESLDGAHSVNEFELVDGEDDVVLLSMSHEDGMDINLETTITAVHSTGTPLVVNNSEDAAVFKVQNTYTDTTGSVHIHPVSGQSTCDIQLIANGRSSGADVRLHCSGGDTNSEDGDLALFGTNTYFNMATVQTVGRVSVGDTNGGSSTYQLTVDNTQNEAQQFINCRVAGGATKFHVENTGDVVAKGSVSCVGQVEIQTAAGATGSTIQMRGDPTSVRTDATIACIGTDTSPNMGNLETRCNCFILDGSSAPDGGNAFFGVNKMTTDRQLIIGEMGSVDATTHLIVQNKVDGHDFVVCRNDGLDGEGYPPYEVDALKFKVDASGNVWSKGGLQLKEHGSCSGPDVTVNCIHGTDANNHGQLNLMCGVLDISTSDINIWNDNQQVMKLSNISDGESVGVTHVSLYGNNNCNTGPDVSLFASDGNTTQNNGTLKVVANKAQFQTGSAGSNSSLAEITGDGTYTYLHLCAENSLPHYDSTLRAHGGTADADNKGQLDLLTGVVNAPMVRLTGKVAGTAYSPDYLTCTGSEGMNLAITPDGNIHTVGFNFISGPGKDYFNDVDYYDGIIHCVGGIGDCACHDRIRC